MAAQRTSSSRGQARMPIDQHWKLDESWRLESLGGRDEPLVCAAQEEEAEDVRCVCMVVLYRGNIWSRNAIEGRPLSFVQNWSLEDTASYRAVSAVC